MIPATCVVDIVTEYGAPYNVNNNCVDSRMEANNVSNRIDALCINSGSAPSISAATPVALADCNNAKTAVAANIGICAAGAAGINTSTLNGGATGLNAAPASSVCWVTGGTGNANVTCTAAGFSGGGGGNWVTLWYLSNRGDEIMTYTITPTAGSCAGIGVIVLPIELVNFAAWKTSSDIQLGWTTASESNNNYFTVEYSLNGINFIPYKEIKGAGNSSEEKKYSCDFNEDTGNEIPYFRLKQVDYNGNFSYSHIIRSGTSYGALKNLGLNLKTYYNAGIDKIAGKFHLDFPQFVKIALYDMTGREINSLNGQYDEGDNEVLIQAPETTGIYFLVYEDENNAPVHKKIIISR